MKKLQKKSITVSDLYVIKIRVPLYVKNKFNFFGFRKINFQTFFANKAMNFIRHLKKLAVRALSGLKRSAIASYFKSR